MKPAQVVKIFQALKDALPAPQAELDYHNPFTLLIAVMLSAQSTDKQVNVATAKLFAVAQSPQQMLDLGLEKLTAFIRSIGLYNSKARHILKTCQILLAEFNGEVPATQEGLAKLPGVGRKTAQVVLNVAFDQATLAVDTHVFRVANRTGLAKGRTPLEVERQLTALVPDEFIHNAHHWLILHGRYTCTARSPKCASCVINTHCASFNGAASS